MFWEILWYKRQEYIPSIWIRCRLTLLGCVFGVDGKLGERFTWEYKCSGGDIQFKFMILFTAHRFKRGDASNEGQCGDRLNYVRIGWYMKSVWPVKSGLCQWTLIQILHTDCALWEPAFSKLLGNIIDVISCIIYVNIYNPLTNPPHTLLHISLPPHQPLWATNKFTDYVCIFFSFFRALL